MSRKFQIGDRVKGLHGFIQNRVGRVIEIGSLKVKVQWNDNHNRDGEWRDKSQLEKIVEEVSREELKEEEEKEEEQEEAKADEEDEEEEDRKYNDPADDIIVAGAAVDDDAVAVRADVRVAQGNDADSSEGDDSDDIELEDISNKRKRKEAPKTWGRVFQETEFEDDDEDDDYNMEDDDVEESDDGEDDEDYINEEEEEEEEKEFEAEKVAMWNNAFNTLQKDMPQQHGKASSRKGKPSKVGQKHKVTGVRTSDPSTITPAYRIV